MASLELRNGKYRIVFRFGRQKFSRSLRTSDLRTARHSMVRLEDNLRRMELGTLQAEPGADIASLLLSSGQLSQRPMAKKAPTLGETLDLYLKSIPVNSIEPMTFGMLNTHIRHLKRIIGIRTQLTKISLDKLQQYINNRSSENGIRGRNVSPVTIRKELTTLNAAWKWALENEMVYRSLPNKNRLRFPKRDEKPPFKTWTEIERIIERAKLNVKESREYWDCVFLDTNEICDLLMDIQSLDVQEFIHPMFSTAAYTGARRSELLRSQIEDVDLESGHMVIREKKRIKGQRSTRSVPIAPKLALTLNDWFSRHPGGRFTFCLGGESLSRDQAHDYFSRTVANTKWEVLRGWHVLRHSFISNCASQGVDQRMIDDWVGHQTEEMRRRYRHLFPHRQSEALAAVFG